MLHWRHYNSPCYLSNQICYYGISDVKYAEFYYIFIKLYVKKRCCLAILPDVNYRTATITAVSNMPKFSSDGLVFEPGTMWTIME